MASLPGLTAVAIADALVVAAAVGHAAGLAPFAVLVLPAYVTAAIGLSLFQAGTHDAGAARHAQAAGAANLLGFIVLLLLILAASLGPGLLPGPVGFPALAVGLVCVGTLVWNARLVAALGRPRLAAVLAALHVLVLVAAALLARSPSWWAHADAALLAAPALVAAAAVPWALGLLRLPAHGATRGFSRTALLDPA